VANEPIDKAYVEITPDVKNFDRDVDRALDRSFDRIEDKLDDLTDTIERQFDRLIVTLDAHFDRLQLTAENAFDEIQDAARDAGKSIATDITIGAKVAKHEIDDLADSADHDFNRIERKARGSGFSIMGIFSKMGSGIANIFSNIGETVSNLGSKISSSLGSTIGQVGSSLGTVSGSVGGALQFAAYGIAIPLVLGLAGAVSQLVGALAALPAAAGVAVTAILPLVLAFHGFTDAIGAVLEGDPEKINEALKKLSPSAASVVKEFSALVKPFKEIQKLAQEALFKPLVGTLTQLATAVLPALRTGVPLVANAFGRMFEFISRAFSNGEFQGVLVNTFATTARIIEGITPELGRFAELFISLWQLGLPFVERFFSVLTRGFGVFNSFIEKSVNGGKVTGWLEKAWHVGSQLWQVFKQLSIYVGTLLGSFADEGTDTLDGIIAALAKANEYLKSTEGQETLHNLGVIVHWAGNAFVFLLDNISAAWSALNGFFAFIRGIGPFFAGIGRWFADLWDDIVSGVSSAWTWIKNTVVGAWNAIVNFFTSTGSSIGSFFSNLWTGIVNGIVSFVNGAIAWLRAFPGALKQFIVDAINQTAYNIGYMIGLMIRFFTTDLPNGVMAGLRYLRDGAINTWTNIVNFFTETIPNLATNVGIWFRDGFIAAYNWVVSTGNMILNWVGELPGKIGDIVGRVQSTVSNGFDRAWRSAYNWVTKHGSDILNWVGGLPGRIQGAVNSLLGIAENIGRDIVRGIINGLKSAGGWLVDEAKNLARRAFEGAKDALGINSPSKLFMELGIGSGEGFVKGLREYPIGNDVGSAIKTPITQLGRSMGNHAEQSIPNVSIGGAQIIAYLQIGDDQLHPVMVRTIQDNPQTVALAAEQGTTQLARRR
jgi:phage-related protein